MNAEELRRAPLSIRLFLGVAGGLSIGLLLSAWAGLLWLTTGRVGRSTVSLPLAVTLYLLGSVLAGAVFGAAAPSARDRWSAGFVGAIGISPTYLWVGYIVSDDPLSIAMTAAAGALVGVFVGQRFLLEGQDVESNAEK
jgi:hypothetical protein